jgi:predicted DNA repair protein MutK
MQSFGKFMVIALPWVIKALGIVGTLAMLLVAGGIFVHHVHAIHEFFHHWPSILAELFVGLVVGGLVFIVVKTLFWIKKKLF